MFKTRFPVQQAHPPLLANLTHRCRATPTPWRRSGRAEPPWRSWGWWWEGAKERELLEAPLFWGVRTNGGRGQMWGDGEEVGGCKGNSMRREEGGKVAGRKKRVISQQQSAKQEGKPEYWPYTFKARETVLFTFVSTHWGRQCTERANVLCEKLVLEGKRALSLEVESASVLLGISFSPDCQEAWGLPWCFHPAVALVSLRICLICLFSWAARMLGIQLWAQGSCSRNWCKKGPNFLPLRVTCSSLNLDWPCDCLVQNYGRSNTATFQSRAQEALYCCFHFPSWNPLRVSHYGVKHVRGHWEHHVSMNEAQILKKWGRGWFSVWRGWFS